MEKKCPKNGCAGKGVFEEPCCPGSDNEENVEGNVVDWLMRRHHCVDCGQLWTNDKGTYCEMCCDFWCPDYQDRFSYIENSDKWICPTCKIENDKMEEVKFLKRKITELENEYFHAVRKKVKKEALKRKMDKLPIWSKRIAEFYNLPKDSNGMKTIRSYCERVKWVDYGPGEGERDGYKELIWDDVPLYEKVSYVWNNNSHDHWEIDGDILTFFDGTDVSTLPDKYKASKKDWRDYIEHINLTPNGKPVKKEIMEKIPPPWKNWMVTFVELEEILFEAFIEIIASDINKIKKNNKHKANQ